MAMPQTAPGVGFPGIDPSSEEMSTITTVTDIFDWIGSSKAFIEAANTALGGGVPRIRDLVAIGTKDWQAVSDSIKVGDRLMSPIERGHFALLRRIIRLRVQLPANDDSGTSSGPVGTTLAIPGAAAPPLPLAEARIKLSVLVDPAMDSELIRLSGLETRIMYDKYVSVRGAEPKEEIDPTTEQLSAVKQIIDAGLAPYVDFSLFGPYGKRFLAKLSMVAWSYQPNGQWLRRELPGPPTFEYWWSSFRVLRTTFLLLGAVDTELLDNYGELLRGFHNTYGPEAWFIIYMADVRMRNEHFERIRRQVERQHDREELAGIKSEFDVAKPWNTVFAKAVADKDWWADNLHRDAMLYLGRIRTAAQITDDGTAQPALDHHRGGGQVGNFDGKGQGRANNKRKKNNNKGKEYSGICAQFNSAKGCRRTECNQEHICSVCKKPGHSKTNCWQNPSSSSSKTWGAPKGSDGGKAKKQKGKGGGKGKKQH